MCVKFFFNFFLYFLKKQLTYVKLGFCHLLVCDFFYFFKICFLIKKMVTCQNMVLSCVNRLCEQSLFDHCFYYFVSI